MDSKNDDMLLKSVMYVCMYVCIFVCLYVCMYGFYACVNEEYMYACIYACMYVYFNKWRYVCMQINCNLYFPFIC